MSTKIIFLLVEKHVYTLLFVSTNARGIKIEAKSIGGKINSHYFGNGNANNGSVLIGSGKVEVNDGALGRH